MLSDPDPAGCPLCQLASQAWKKIVRNWPSGSVYPHPYLLSLPDAVFLDQIRSPPPILARKKIIIMESFPIHSKTSCIGIRCIPSFLTPLTWSCATSHNFILLCSSVVDPNTLNLDPDPGFWPNLDTDPGLYYQFWKKKLNIILEKIFFLQNSTGIYF